MLFGVEGGAIPMVQLPGLHPPPKTFEPYDRVKEENSEARAAGNDLFEEVRTAGHPKVKSAECPDSSRPLGIEPSQGRHKLDSLLGTFARAKHGRFRSTGLIGEKERKVRSRARRMCL